MDTASKKPKVLIVDDERPTRDVMARALARNYDCLAAADAELALRELDAHPDVALMISDIRMPGEDGVSLVQRAKAAHPGLACILLTAYGTVELAVDAMKKGADDFIPKPVTNLDELEARVAKAIRTGTLERQVADLQSQLGPTGPLDAFTGDAPAMREVYRLVRLAAPTPATVLVQGPSGTGKELVARALHDLSPRRDGPFVPVECASLPAALLETELFGAVRGAYTDARDRAGCFEAADGGTIFLDEIGEIDMALQVKLLRVLETHTFSRVGEAAVRKSDFRLVTATNRDLAAMVAAGTFREDLYYRLNVVAIRTPALAEHPTDIPALVKRFLKEISAAYGNRVTGIDEGALARFATAAWPGNVRQLRNAVERAVVLAPGPVLTAADVEGCVLKAEPAPAPAAARPAPDAGVPAATDLSTVEKEKILAVLAACGGNKTKAAEQLGISRRTLHRKINEWNARTSA